MVRCRPLAPSRGKAPGRPRLDLTLNWLGRRPPRVVVRGGGDRGGRARGAATPSATSTSRYRMEMFRRIRKPPAPTVRGVPRGGSGEEFRDETVVRVGELVARGGGRGPSACRLGAAGGRACLRHTPLPPNVFTAPSERRGAPPPTSRSAVAREDEQRGDRAPASRTAVAPGSPKPVR